MDTRKISDVRVELSLQPRTDIRSDPRSYFRSTDIRKDIRLDIGAANIRVRSFLWISVIVRKILHGIRNFTNIQVDILMDIQADTRMDSLFTAPIASDTYSWSGR